MASTRPIELSDSDRSELEGWLRTTTIRKGSADRARMILLSADGVTVRKTAQRVGVSAMSVLRWRKRFAAEGIPGLKDRPRSGQPRKMTPAKAKEVLRLTTERIPKESTHWSLRLMARYAGVTIHQVRQVWKAADLRPHRVKTFKISNDPRFPSQTGH